MPDAAWIGLLSWLEKHGFDRNTLKVDLHESPAGGGRKLIATIDILPQQTLIQLPNSTLLHSVAIAPLYDIATVEKLSAIQLLCLHLSLHRYSEASQSADLEDFVPYIRTLPQDFSTVPLWREVVQDEGWTSLVNEDGLLPSGLRIAMEDVSKRFWKDWQRTSEVWSAKNPEDTKTPLNVEDFAWAWLCVNSRCIYYDLELPSREDNITLAPIIDMGNHSPRQAVSSVLTHSGGPLTDCTAQTKIVQLEDTFTLVSSGLDSHISDWSEKNILIHKGSEVLYSYSTHSDYILFAEYGFAIGMPANTDNVLDVTSQVLRMFEDLEDEEKELKKSILEANDYWGEYHFLFTEGGEIEVSYRLTMALAMYHLRPSHNKDSVHKSTPSPRKRSKTNEDPEWDFQPFYDLVNGVTEEISPKNVELSNESLLHLCKDVAKDSKTALARLDRIPQVDQTMIDLLKTVWKDELYFAEQYLKQCS